MVKFTAATKDGRTLVGLGISEENVIKMKKGQPIHVNGSEIGIKEDIMIFYGVTEQHMKNQLSSFIGPDTKMRGTD